MRKDLEITTVPKELYYHEVAYVRGLGKRIEALETALHKIDDITIDHTAMGIARKALASAALASEQEK